MRSCWWLVVLGESWGPGILLFFFFGGGGVGGGIMEVEHMCYTCMVLEVLLSCYLCYILSH